MKKSVNLIKLDKICKLSISVIFLVLCVFASYQEIFAAGKVTLTATPAMQTVAVGKSADFVININRDGFAGKVTLSASSLPAGVTAVFNPNSTTGKSSVLTLKTVANTPVGSFNITIKGAADAVTIAPITVKLETKPADAFSVNVFPQSQSIIAGQETVYEVAVSRNNYDGVLLFSAENVPAGVTVKFEPKETNGNSTQMRLYSNGLPHLPAEFGMNIVVTARDIPYFKTLTPVRLRVNCDIVWIEQFGVPDNSVFRPDFAEDITLDNPGNVYAIGDTHIPDSNGNFGGNFDGWVAKYAPDGGRFWLTDVNLGNLQGLENHATAVAVDNNGNVYVAGYTRMSSSDVDYNIFIAKFDAQGRQIGQNVFGTRVLEDGSKKMDLSFDDMGRAVLTGAVGIRRGNIILGGTTFEIADFAIARVVFDANLNIVSGFPNPFINNAVGEPSAVSVGSDGSIYAAGSILDQNISRYRAWVRKYNAGGVLVWEYLYPVPPNNQSERAVRIEVDNRENSVFVAGGNFTPRMFAEQPLSIWVSKLDSAGVPQWKFINSTPNDDFISTLAVDANGDVFFGGWTEGNLAANNPDSGSNSDIWMAKRSGSDGSLIFIRQFAVGNKDELSALKIDNAGNLFLAGNTVFLKNVNYGYEDAFVMKFTPGSGYPFLQPSITAITPQTVQSGNQFTITGNNLSFVEGVFFNGNSMNFTIISPTQINAVAPPVFSAATAPVSISSGCKVNNSPTNLTVTP